MPLIYRAMFRDGDHPEVGPTRKSLGVLIPGDIAEANGSVMPGTGGMSVSSSWRQLPMHRVPKRLNHLAPKAAGSNRFECWKMGEGPFLTGPVVEGLTLRPDKPYHGVVEPPSPMTA